MLGSHIPTLIGVIAAFWILLRLTMSNHEDLQAVGMFVVIGLACFFGFLATPWFASPLNWILSVSSAVAVLIIGAVYFAWRWFSDKQPPPIQGQEWIRERINVTTIERWIPNPTRSYGDGSFAVSGMAITGSDAKYEYNIRITKDGRVIPDQSSVTGVA
jgi:predicted membrane channel-forming protein YqfA (hemolysin III family)